MHREVKIDKSFILDQTSKLKSGGNGHTWPPETLLGCTTEQGTKNTKM